jgi:deoxyribose-phosphate aldolase
MLTRDFFYKRFYASLIGPQFSDHELVKSIEACKNHDCYIAGVTVNLHQISLAATLLKDSGINLIGSVAYPLGNLPTDLKVVQIEEAIRDGAVEVHVVMKVEALMIGDYESARKDAQAIIEACRKIKFCALISNTAYLTEHQALQAARIALDLGAIYMTNSGFGLVTKLDDVRIIREAFGKEIQIIVSGGCRKAEQAINYLKTGSNKIATSTPFNIFEEIEELIALQTIS